MESLSSSSKNKHSKFIFTLCLISILMISCIERGKPSEKNKEVKTEDQVKPNTKKLAHYICPNGHSGADAQGKCSECDAVLQHNQAFHGLNIPKDGIKDPFSGANSNANPASSAPAQNKYGDYHYICPNGHSGGSGTAGSCTTCEAELTHNQLYHK